MRKKFNILIIGEVILDSYNNGRVINHEQNSNAPIFLCEKKDIHLGGAGNVAANVSLANMNAYIGTIVNLSYAKLIKEQFEKFNVSTDYMFSAPNFPTSIKYRFYENDSILFRVDKEKILQTDTYTPIREHLIASITNNIELFDCIIISDYNKGLLDAKSLEHIIELAQKHSISIIVDPACTEKRTYKNATVIKLNKKELEYFTNIAILNKNSLKKASQLLLNYLSCKIVIVTCSDEGIFYLDYFGNTAFRQNKSFANAHVIGAGDTIIAYTAYGLLYNFPIEKLLNFLSVAGELAVKESGTTTVPIEKVFYELRRRNDK